MRKSSGKLPGVLTALAATALWGGSYPVGRLLFNRCEADFDGLSFSLLRFIISALILSPALADRAAWRTLRSCWREDAPKIAGLAAVGIVAEGVLLFFSTKYTTAARSSILANTAPIFTVFISHWATREVISGRKLSGMIVGAAGMLAAVASHGEDVFSGGASTLAGDVLAMSSGICWAVYTVFGAKPVEKYGAWFLTELLFISAALLMIPVIFLSGNTFSLPTSIIAWSGLLYWGVLANAAAFGLWYAALKYLKPGELGAFGYLTPLVSVILSVLLFAEKISWPFCLSACLIFAGIKLMFTSFQQEKK